jgi:hypothetical protein
VRRSRPRRQPRCGAETRSDTRLRAARGADGGVAFRQQLFKQRRRRRAAERERSVEHGMRRAAVARSAHQRQRRQQPAAHCQHACRVCERAL